MIHSRLKLIFLLMFFVTTAEAQQGQSVLLPRSATKELVRLGYLVAPSIGDYWKPTKVDIDTLEKNLSGISSLRSEGAPRGMQIAQPSKDNRQYVAILTNGKKTIFVNAFCMHPSKSWTTRLEVICDGGTCVWRVIYDVETKTFSHLTTNGRA